MSARELQRVVVRMHHDPRFVDAVLRDPDAALAGLDLTGAERALLRTPDRRAWGVDPARRDRVLEAVRREFVVTCALAEVAAGRAALLGFFASAEFHRAVQQRGLLAPAFGAWIGGEARSGRFGKLPTAEVAKLEAAAAVVRRAAEFVGGGPGLRRAPWVEVVSVRSGSLELYRAVFGSVRARGVVPKSRPRLQKRAAFVAVERLPNNEIVLGALPAATAEILALAEAPLPRSAVLAKVRALGVEPPEDADVVESLLADRLLVSAEIP